MKMFDEEKKYLDYVLNSIDIEIEKLQNEMKILEDNSRNLSFEDRKRGAHFQLNSNMENTGKNIEQLKYARPVPYFGRIDVSLSNYEQDETIYIGRVGISHDNKSIVTDWRAPICSIYYDSEIGKASYKAHNIEYSVYLKLKRQINIKNSKLVDVQDASLVVNDELLKPYLSLNADNKMKTIVASIQKEQNDIIRKPINMNLIVQGVAGSGKTSVALHRIAYLLYNKSSGINAQNFLIIGPNDYFLNYISSILPELDTSPVNQQTMISFLNEYIGGNLTLKDSNINGLTLEEEEIYRKIEKFKTSLEYKNTLDSFINDYLQNMIVVDDFKIDDIIIFSKDEVKKILFSINPAIPNFNKINNYFKAKFKNDIDKILDQIYKKYRNMYINLSFEDPNRKKLVEESNNISNKIKKDGIKLLDKYLKNLNKSPMDIYMMFVSNFEKYNKYLSKKESLYLQKFSLLKLNKNSICFADIPSLIHLKYCITGEKLDYKYMIIDEAQDYDLFHFYVLNEITNNCNFSIYGDLAQSIYSYRSIDDWNDLKNDIFNGNCEMLYLDKSYRTTIEITENANSVLNQLDLKLANPVIRSGEPVLFVESSDDIEIKVNIINQWLEKGYQTIAIICKTDKEALKTSKELIKAGISNNLLTIKDKQYNGNVFVLTSASSKGLEFDAVIINDASDKNYSIDSDVDMHLLYVASTRALHEECILYNKKITQVYESKLDDYKVKKFSKNRQNNK